MAREVRLALVFRQEAAQILRRSFPSGPPLGTMNSPQRRLRARSEVFLNMFPSYFHFGLANRDNVSVASARLPRSLGTMVIYS